MQEAAVGLPDSSKKTEIRREELFRFQSTRHKLVDAIKRCTDTEHGIARNLRDALDRVGKGAQGELDESQNAVIEELGALERVKASCKERLDHCISNEVTIKLLDELLEGLGMHPTCGILWQIPPGADRTWDEVNRIQSTKANDLYKSVTQHLKSRYGDLDFLGDRASNDNTDEIFTTRPLPAEHFKHVQVSREILGPDRAASVVDLEQYDNTVAAVSLHLALPCP